MDDAVHRDDQIRQFVIRSIAAMNYDTDGVTGDTTLGPAGIDLESLAVAELVMQVEDEFGVKFSDEDTEKLALLTVAGFAAQVGGKLAVPAGGKAE